METFRLEQTITEMVWDRYLSGKLSLKYDGRADCYKGMLGTVEIKVTYDQIHFYDWFITIDSPYATQIWHTEAMNNIERRQMLDSIYKTLVMEE